MKSNFVLVISIIALFISYWIFNNQKVKHDVSVEQFRIFNAKSSIKPSSIWCHENNQQIHSIYCRIESLCLRMDTYEYIFIFDPYQSFFYPSRLQTYQNKFEFGRLSSVIGHNLYEMKHLVTIRLEDLDILNKTIFNIDGQTLLMSRFKPDNLMHLIHDDLLPLMATIKMNNIENLNHIFIDDHWPHRYGMDLFGKLFNVSLWHKNQFPSDSIVCFQNSFIGLTNLTVWYQYGFRDVQGPVPRTSGEYNFIRQNILLFRDRIVRKLDLKSHCPIKQSILLVRTINRRIINYNNFLQFLQTKFNNIKLIQLESFSMDNITQVEKVFQLFQCCNTLIAMHGSEHILSIFMDPGSTVIELFPFGIESTNYQPYRTLATIIGHRYYTWTNQDLRNSFFPIENQPHTLLKLTPKQRNEIIANIKQPMKPHLCCDNHDWLFRIYQDTIIDIDHFEQFLHEHHDNSTKPIISNVIQLSEVTNLQCHRPFNSQLVVITWNEPWNWILWNQTKPLYYHVLIADQEQTNASIIETDRSHLLLNRTNNCQIWVKPVLKNEKQIIGSFNRNPLKQC
ncbi:Protein O-linked-mannose beta-1,4-N-acetylglucosaminyltransferase 2 [Blomia tropicalis]|nr:Protein O-linked-mannose beta-1,4-N-acetylglucosaminyltransferase 2 [Blomia tropicalis]